MAVPTQLSDLSATAASNSPAGGDTVGTTMDDYIRAIQSIIVRISAGTDAMATPNIGAATGTSLVLSGLATVNGAFTSLGLDDNATAKALTLSGSGANSVTIANSATNPAIGTSAGSLVLSSAGVAGLLIAPNATADTYAQLTMPASGNNYAAIVGQGSGADVGMFVSSKGTGAVSFYTGSLARLQVAVTDTASAVRYLTLTGAIAGGNPTIGTSAGSLDFNPVGQGVSLRVSTGGASTVNFLHVAGGTTGSRITALATGSDTNVGASWQTKGSGSHLFVTGTGASAQVEITHTASADRYITLTGSNGGNPKIGVSDGQLTLGTGSALATSATEGYVCIPTCAGAPTGVPAGAGAGNLPLIYDTTNNKLYAYNGAWKATAALT